MLRRIVLMVSVLYALPTLTASCPYLEVKAPVHSHHCKEDQKQTQAILNNISTIFSNVAHLLDNPANLQKLSTPAANIFESFVNICVAAHRNQELSDAEVALMLEPYRQELEMLLRKAIRSTRLGASCPATE